MKVYRQKQKPLAYKPQHVVRREALLIVQQHVLDALLADTGDFGEAQALRCDSKFGKTHSGTFLPGEPFAEGALGKLGVGQAKLDEVVESPIQRTVEQMAVIRGRDDDAVAAMVLNEDEEGIQHPAHFTDIVFRAACDADGVKLVKEIDCPSPLHGIENHP